MHELPIIQGLLETASLVASREKLVRVTSVTLRIGELSDLVDECMQLYWETASTGTICNGAALRIQREPATFVCHSCGRRFPHSGDFRCPCCGGDASLVRGTGTGCVIESIEGDTSSNPEKENEP